MPAVLTSQRLRQVAGPADPGHPPARPPRDPRADRRHPPRRRLRRLVHPRRQPPDHRHRHDEERRLRPGPGPPGRGDRGLRRGPGRPLPRAATPTSGRPPSGSSSSPGGGSRSAAGATRTPSSAAGARRGRRRSAATATASRVESGLDGLQVLKTDRLGLLRLPPRPLHDPARDDRPHLRHRGPGPLDLRRRGDGRLGRRPSRAVRRALLETFAGHESLAVQQTLHAMGEAALGGLRRGRGDHADHAEQASHPRRPRTVRPDERQRGLRRDRRAVRPDHRDAPARRERATRHGPSPSSDASRARVRGEDGDARGRSPRASCIPRAGG